jgi:FAD synthetase
MSLERLVSEYICSAERVLHELQMAKTSATMDVERVKQVCEWAKDYLEDARYYREKKKFEVSLTSVAYCEGLLDALRLLGAVNFEWSTKTKGKRKAK